MKNLMRRTVSAFLAACMLLISGIAAYAAEPAAAADMPEYSIDQLPCFYSSAGGLILGGGDGVVLMGPRTDSIVSVGAKLSRKGDTLTATSTVSIRYPNVSTGMVMTLLKSRDGGSWSEVTHWTDSTTDEGTTVFSEKWAVVSGYQYQMKVVVTTTRNGYSEMVTKYSGIVDYT